MAKEEVAESTGQTLVIPDDTKQASRFVVELFRTKAIYAPGLKFENPTLTPEEKAEMSEIISESRHNATTLEELLEGSKLTASKDYLNRPFKIGKVAWRGSTIAGEGLPIFAILTLVLPDGTEKKIGTGAASVVESLAIADVADWFGLESDKEWLKFTGVKILDDERRDTGRVAVELHTAGDLAPFQ